MYLKDNKSMNVLKIRHFCNFIGKILMDFMIYTDAGNRGQSSLSMSHNVRFGNSAFAAV